MLQTERKEEYEDPPGQRPPLWEGLARERGNGCYWQLFCHLDTVEDLARVIHLTMEEVGGFLVPGLFRADVSPHAAPRIDLNGAIRLIRGRVTPLVKAGTAGGTPRPWLNASRPQLSAQVGHHPQHAHSFRCCARGRIVGHPCASFRCGDYARQLTGLMEVVR